jgi:hypothetical protein
MWLRIEPMVITPAGCATSGEVLDWTSDYQLSKDSAPQNGYLRDKRKQQLAANWISDLYPWPHAVTSSDTADSEVPSYWPEDKLLISGRARMCLLVIVTRSTLGHTPAPTGSISKSFSGCRWPHTFMYLQGYECMEHVVPLHYFWGCGD